MLNSADETEITLGGPGQVTGKGRVVGVTISVQHYDRLWGAAWARLAETMDTLGEGASGNDMSETALDVLLPDEV